MKKIGILWLAPLLLLLFIACGGDSSNDEGGDKPTPSPSGKHFVMGVKLTRHEVKTLVESDSANSHGTFLNYWGESSKVQIIGKQGDLVEDFGKVTATNITDNVLANFEVDLSNSKLNINNSIVFYGFTSGINGGVKNGRVYYDASQRKGGSPGYWFKAGSSVPVNAQLCGVTEIVYIANKTNSNIIFCCNGFATEEKWYYTKALIDVADNSIFDASEGSEVANAGIWVNPGELNKTITTYAPTGKKINNAQLIATINGEEVRSVNRITSDIIPQIGHIYAIYATWDGEKLMLGDNAGNSVVEIPAGANIEPGDIKLYGDGEEVSMDSNGHFSSSASSMVALGKENKIMYISYLSTESENKDHDIVLNSRETATSLLISALPYVLTINDDVIFKRIKDNIGNFQETKALADAIDRSIVKNGYFEMDDISAEYNAGYQKLKDLIGLGNVNNTYSSRTKASVTPIYPMVPNYDPNEARMSFILDKDKCEWKYVTKPEAMNVWQCSFTVTSIRFSPMALLVGHLNEDGSYTPYPLEDIYDLFKIIIPAYSMKTVYDRMTFSPSNYKGIIEQYKLIKYSFVDGRVHAIDEALKEDVMLSFRSEKDGIVALGPMDHEYLKMYHVLYAAICPILKQLGADIIQKVKSDEGGTNEAFNIFCISIMKDLINTKKIVSLIEIIDSEQSSKVKAKEIAGIIWPVIKDYIKKGVNKELAGLTDDLFKSLYEKNANNVENVEVILNDTGKFIETVIKIEDFVFQMWVGTKETGFFLPMNLDFNIPGASLDEIPGENY